MNNLALSGIINELLKRLYISDLECRDISSVCAIYWDPYYWCTQNELLRLQCKKTCGLCNTNSIPNYTKYASFGIFGYSRRQEL